MSFGETFLKDPAAFPTAIEGEPWGDLVLDLELAGGPYRLSGLDKHLLEVARELFRGFVMEGEQAEIRAELRCLRALPSRFLDFDTAGWPQSFDIEHHPDAVILAGYGFAARLEWCSGLEAHLWLSEALDDPYFALANAYRVVVANRLLDVDGVLLHSSCVVDGDRATLFIGPSGAGKTTIARIAEAGGATVIGDDMNVLRLGKSGIEVEDFPVAGAMRRRPGQRGVFPVTAVFRLRRGDEVAARVLRPSRAIAGLLGCASFVNHDPYRASQLEAVLHAVATSGRVAEISFSRTSSWSELQRVIEESAWSTVTLC